VAEIVFEIEKALAEARAAEGLDDFGDPAFREGLEVLLETFRHTAGFSEKGRRRNWRRVVQLLSTRLRMEAAFARHPEIRDRKVRSPMVLTGLPRSGTSALFNLLAVDPAARPLLLWEAIFPDPLPGGEAGAADPRRDALEAHYAKGREKNPEFTKMHYTGADKPEECVLLMAHAFCDVQMGIEPMMEPYASWFRQQDFRRMYRDYREWLKLLDWRRPGERWLLKAPAHLWALDVLVETFPDVSIVWTHRNPLECVASICSLTAMLMSGRESFDRKELGPVVLDFYATSLERGLASRRRIDPDRIIDVDYRRFVSEPVATAERLHAAFNLRCDDELMGAFRRHVEENPKGRFGSHDYELEAYGVAPDRVRERFADYAREFDLPFD
jgi:hypothetical protein